jgi:hypothetical protein
MTLPGCETLDWPRPSGRRLPRSSGIDSNRRSTHNGAMLVAPPGWPRQVRPPDAPDWEATACSWLLDQCPPDYRGYPALRRHPIVLARFAVLHIEANQAACRRGLSEARSGMREVADLDVVEAAITTWQAEEARLLGVRREAGLVEEALRGRRYRARL